MHFKNTQKPTATPTHQRNARQRNTHQRNRSKACTSWSYLLPRSAWIRSRVSSESRARSAALSPVVAIGLPNVTRTRAGRTLKLSAGMATSAPSIRTGTIGTPASIAAKNTPYLNGCIPCPRERVPSGNAITLRPARICRPILRKLATTRI